MREGAAGGSGMMARQARPITTRGRSGHLVGLVLAAASALVAVGVALLWIGANYPSVPRRDERQPPAPTTGSVRQLGPAPNATQISTEPVAGGAPTTPPVADPSVTPSNPAPLFAPSPPLKEPEVVGDPRVEAALRALQTDQDRVGQLLLLGWVGSTAEPARTTIQELRPGGIVHVDNTKLSSEATAINGTLMRLATDAALIRPLIAIDHEGGLVQRISDVRNYGSNLDFARRGATDADACARGIAHAEQLRSMGFSMNLAPVLDVNNNPNNPVIGTRSYGADPQLVARLGSAYIRGLQGGGIAAVGKHFPGHGNTGVDSHLLLPILPQGVDDLERIELVPFRRAIGAPANVSAIMSAHIVFPAVDSTRMPATMSREIMTGILRERLGYQGLVLSDDLAGMKAITDNFGPGEAAVKAIRAGVDMLIIAGGNARQRESRDALLAALARGELGRDRLDEAVRHVLSVKARFGLLGGAPDGEPGCD